MRNFEETKLNRYRIRSGLYGSDDEAGNNGSFNIPLGKGCRFFVIASSRKESGWDHVSGHIKRRNKHGRVVARTPSWDEMCLLKSMFFGEEETVVQYHPAKSVYVDCHPHVLHLWRPIGLEMPVPPMKLV